MVASIEKLGKSKTQGFFIKMVCLNLQKGLDKKVTGESYGKLFDLHTLLMP